MNENKVERRGRPKMDPSLLKNPIKIKVPGRTRGRPKCTTPKTKKKMGKRGRPTGSLNTINYFKENSAYKHLRMWEVRLFRGIFRHDDFTFDTIVSELDKVDGFYKRNTVVNGQKIDMYEHIVEYFVDTGFLNKSRKTELYSINYNYSMS